MTQSIDYERRLVYLFHSLNLKSKLEIICAYNLVDEGDYKFTFQQFFEKALERAKKGYYYKYLWSPLHYAQDLNPDPNPFD